jgi:hypothetical protein
VGCASSVVHTTNVEMYCRTSIVMYLVFTGVHGSLNIMMASLLQRWQIRSAVCSMLSSMWYVRNDRGV